MCTWTCGTATAAAAAVTAAAVATSTAANAIGATTFRFAPHKWMAMKMKTKLSWKDETCFKSLRFAFNLSLFLCICGSLYVCLWLWSFHLFVVTCFSKRLDIPAIDNPCDSFRYNISHLPPVYCSIVFQIQSNKLGVLLLSSWMNWIVIQNEFTQLHMHSIDSLMKWWFWAVKFCPRNNARLN